MSQEYNSPEIPPELKEQFDFIERRQREADWFFKIMIPATFLLLIVGVALHLWRLF